MKYENFKSKNIISLFNTWAENGRHDRMAEGHKTAVNQMLAMLEGIKKSSFLDIGCGNGWVVRRVAQFSDCKISYGIDVSNKMIDIARMRSFDEKELFFCHDWLSWEIEKKIDVIFSMETMYYMPSIVKALRKVFDMLSNHGVFIMGVDFYEENKSSHSWPEMVGLGMQLKSINEWKKLFETVGFQKVSIYQLKDKNSDEIWKRDYGTLVIKADK